MAWCGYFFSGTGASFFNLSCRCFSCSAVHGQPSTELMTWVVVNLVSPNRLGFKAFGFGFNPLLDGLPADIDFLLPNQLGILPD